MKKFGFLFLISLSFQSYGDTIRIVTPDPGCEQINTVGLAMPGDWYTNYYVSGWGDDGTSCEGVTSLVGGIPLNPGEFAFGSLGIEYVKEIPVDSYDFNIHLDGAFIHMPIGEQVKIVEMLAADRMVGDIVLKKIPLISNSGFSRGNTMNNSQENYQWELSVKWYGTHSYLYTVEKYTYQKEDEVVVNQVYDDSDPNAVVQFLDFIGDNQTSYNPYASAGGISSWGNSAGPSTELETYHMGIIDTSIQLIQNDKIFIEVNWSVIGDILL